MFLSIKMCSVRRSFFHALAQRQEDEVKETSVDTRRLEETMRSCSHMSLARQSTCLMGLLQLVSGGLMVRLFNIV